MTAQSSPRPSGFTSAERSSGTVWTGLRDVPSDWPGCAVTMGVFDGFHRGHAALVRRVRERAARHGLPSVLLTFDPHPLTVTCPERAPRHLTSLEERVRLAHGLGIDAVLVLPFTAALADMTADAFADRVLGRTLGARAVVVGENFRFGRAGGGDTVLLGRVGQRLGFTVDAVPLVARDGRTCSSTLIRSRLAAGDLKGVEELLGRPWRSAPAGPPPPVGQGVRCGPAADGPSPGSGAVLASERGPVSEAAQARDEQEAERSGVAMSFAHAGCGGGPAPTAGRRR